MLKLIVFNSVKDDVIENVEFIKIDWNNKVRDILHYCFQHGISSIIVEGGTNTIYNFMNQNAWDEVRVFVNPNKKFEHGIIAPEINLSNATHENNGSDILYTILNT